MADLLYFTHTGMRDIDTDITLDSGVEMKKKTKDYSFTVPAKVAEF